MYNKLILLYINSIDLSGSQDGSVRLWEWAQPQCIAVARQPGSFPKVTHVSFNSQGNKVSSNECLYNLMLLCLLMFIHL